MALVEAEAHELERGAVLAQHELAVAGRGRGGELEHHRQVVGQLGALQRQAGGAVQRLEPQQRRVRARAGLPRA